ncbi:MAG: cell division protein FtsW [Candidatus Vogelbacteria bacterium]|nr:cell division protein FtsW [Candidatus Vogelbacteria bacterium]
MRNKPDKTLFIIVVVLIFFGFFIFTSAAFGLLTKAGADFSVVVTKQLAVAVIMGMVGIFAVSSLHYKKWNRIAVIVFISSIIACALIFVPGLGFASGGARRWLVLGPINVQPAEFLKFGTILFLSHWYSKYKDKSSDIVYGLLPFIFTLGIAALLIIKQPDTGSFLVLAAAAFGIYIAAGAPWKHIVSIILCGLLGLIILISVRPYMMQRIQSFIDPESDSLGASYQIRQSLIAIGSGGIGGRGFGQSVQKFNYLPESIGDSIFAVAGEEFGFIGSSILVLLFMGLGLRGMKIASDAPDPFSRLLATGIVILITAQSFVNMGAMLGILPLTGVPLVFVSHGGTALLFAFVEVGILLNISKYT